MSDNTEYNLHGTMNLLSKDLRASGVPENIATDFVIETHRSAAIEHAMPWVIRLTGAGFGSLGIAGTGLALCAGATPDPLFKIIAAAGSFLAVEFFGAAQICLRNPVSHAFQFDLRGKINPKANGCPEVARTTSKNVYREIHSLDSPAVA